MCLGDKYYDPHDQWLHVGWALHNTSKKLFLTWLSFSSKSDKFDINDIPDLYEKWNEMKVDSQNFKTYSDRSIRYWARIDNKTEYEKINKQSIEYYMEKNPSRCSRI